MVRVRTTVLPGKSARRPHTLELGADYARTSEG